MYEAYSGDTREWREAFAAGAFTAGVEGPELDRLCQAFNAGVDLGWNWHASEHVPSRPNAYPNLNNSTARTSLRPEGEHVFLPQKDKCADTGAKQSQQVPTKTTRVPTPPPCVRGSCATGTASGSGGWETETRLYVCWRGPRYISGTELCGADREKYEGLYFRSWERLKELVGGDPVASGSGLGFERIEPQSGSTSQEWVNLAERF